MDKSGPKDTTRCMSTALSPDMKKFLLIYELIWKMGLTVIPHLPRLKAGLNQRLFIHRFKGDTDIWIQAASVGESFLARSIINSLEYHPQRQILVTTQTVQGYNLLQMEKEKNPNFKNAAIRFFPFDRPSLMEKAVEHIRPKVMVLLETEIWPGLLSALKKRKIRTVIINGRLSEKSLRNYRLMGSLWSMLSPDLILAISEGDANRYRHLFTKSEVAVMPNIKFDQAILQHMGDETNNPVRPIVPEKIPFAILGSIRKPEEKMAEEIMTELFRTVDPLVIGLFPRHMERISHWKNRLLRMGIPYSLRSDLQTTAMPRSIILWDKMGELNHAYSLSQAVFVGGSLAPLGGQNFLEALSCGIIPVIGPHWNNFKWVGAEIIQKGLVRQMDQHSEVAGALIESLREAKDREEVYSKARTYFKMRSGGTKIACRAIESLLCISSNQ